MVETLVVVLVLSVVSWASILGILSLLARRPGNLGVHDGRLVPCPPRPNCVSSQASDADHAIAPLTFPDGPDEAMHRLKRILASWPRTRLITDEDGYLYAECTSRLFRFVDDLECLLDRHSRVIHVRSASRVGRSDLGVNRRRVEALREAFTASPPVP